MSYTCLSNLSLSYLVFGWSLRAFAAKNGVGVVVMSLHICYLNRGKIKIFFFFLLIEFVLKGVWANFPFFSDEPFKIKETRAIIPCSLHLQIHMKIVKKNFDCLQKHLIQAAAVIVNALDQHQSVGKDNVFQVCYNI